MVSARPGQAGGTVAARGGTAPVGWWPLVVITAITLVDRIDTYVVSGVLPLLQDEWGFSDTAGGAIPLAISIAGLAVALPAGYLADRYRRTRLLAMVVAAWSVITMFSGLATSFAMFFITRIVLGAADSLDIPSQSSLFGDYYPPAERAKAYGIHRMVYFAGAGLGVLHGGVIGGLFGWRAAFFVIIVPGLLVAWFAWRLREPARGAIDRSHAGSVLGEAGEGSGASGDPPSGPGEPLVAGSGWSGLRRQIGALWRSRTIRLLLVGVPVFFLGLNGFVYWLPSYLTRTWGVGESRAGLLSSLVLVVGVIGGTLAGAALDRRIHDRLPGGRVLAGGGGMLAGSLLLIAGLRTPSLVVQVGLLTVAVALLAVAIPTLFAASADCLHHSLRGIGFAMLQVGITLGSSLGPLIIGAVSDATGSLTASFMVLGVPMAAAAAIVLAGRSGYERDARHVLMLTSREGIT
ncbi:MAG: MFS transporter [Nitriliruptorales bacterium]|nr:MFS transporter [Nitriliruptorales bacterium]